jgi:hypothetical protein
VLEKYKVRNAVTNGLETGSGKFGQRALHNKASESEGAPDPKDHIGFVAVQRQNIPKGQGLTNEVIDPVKCDTVDPKITALWSSFPANPGWTNKQFDSLNHHSVAIRIDFGKASYLLPGDLEDTTISDFVAYCKDTSLLDVDVYQVGHHGSSNGTTEQLLSAITPAIAVIAMEPSSRASAGSDSIGPRPPGNDLVRRRANRLLSMLCRKGQPLSEPTAYCGPPSTKPYPPALRSQHQRGGTSQVIGSRAGQDDEADSAGKTYLSSVRDSEAPLSPHF